MGFPSNPGPSVSPHPHSVNAPLPCLFPLPIDYRICVGAGRAGSWAACKSYEVCLELGLGAGREETRKNLPWELLGTAGPFGTDFFGGRFRIS